MLTHTGDVVYPLLSSGIFVLLLCLIFRFPPQILGTYSDHFSEFVIRPIPESVKILDVEVDDIMVHPDVAYYFRFSVNREDLKKIISYRRLQSTDQECAAQFSYLPKWWRIKSSGNVEAYTYDNQDWLILTLCYDTSTSIAYYVYWTW
jgi:hypothetical protein